MNFSNQIHPAQNDPTDAINLWLCRNYHDHLTPTGHIDTESLAEAAAVELGIDRQLADDLAALFAAEFDKGA